MHGASAERRRPCLAGLAQTEDPTERARRPFLAGGSTTAPSGTPLSFICELIRLAAYDEIPYVFELEKNERLEFIMRSDAPVDVLLCNMENYWRWVDSGYSLEFALTVYTEVVDVLAYTVRFTAPVAGDYAVLVMNWTDHAADVAVEIPDLLSSPLG
jgi:hypothetical protein